MAIMLSLSYDVKEEKDMTRPLEESEYREVVDGRSVRAELKEMLLSSRQALKAFLMSFIFPVFGIVSRLYLGAGRIPLIASFMPPIIILILIIYTLYKAVFLQQRRYTAMVRQIGRDELLRELKSDMTISSCVAADELGTFAFITPTYIVMAFTFAVKISDIDSLTIQKRYYRESLLATIKKTSLIEMMRNVYMLNIVLKDGRRLHYPICFYPADCEVFIKTIRDIRGVPMALLEPEYL